MWRLIHAVSGITLVCLPEWVVGTARLRAHQRSALQSGESSGTSAFFFNYENHGGDWKIGECGSRTRQSPIDFAGAAPWVAAPSESFFYDYTTIDGAVNVQNTGHAIAVELANQGYGGIWFRGSFYALTSVNFHMHSEHTFHGQSKPLEVHIVHRCDDKAQALIVALPLEFYVDPGITYSEVGSKITCGAENTVTRSFPTYSREQCEKTCTGVATCLAFVTAEDSQCPMCVMYENTDCSERYQIESTCSGNLTAFNKNIVQRDGYFPLGGGKCPESGGLELLGETQSVDGTVALWECKLKCSLSPTCTYISTSDGGACKWFKGGPGLCNKRPEGQDDWQTHQKVEADMNIPLALLLGPDSLPEQGEKKSRQMPFPVDVLGQLLNGGDYFQYEGSLTVPPCTEAATWLVRRAPLFISREQHDRLHDKIYEATSEFGNFRAVMPLMGRNIGVAAAVKGTPPPQPAGSGAAAPGPAPGPAPAPAPPPASAPAPMPGGPPPYVPLWAERQAEDSVGWAYQAQQMASTIGRTLKAFPPPGFTANDISMPPSSVLATSASGGAPPGLAGGAAPVAGLLSLARPTVAEGDSAAARRQMDEMLRASTAAADRSAGAGQWAEAALT